MTNEEIVEEIYNLIYQNNLIDSFTGEVNKITTNSSKKSLYDAVNEVYFKYVKEGLITE